MPQKDKVQRSFPQLKYPSLRDTGVKDPMQWMEGKAIDDNIGPFWRVHNKLYDLTEFIRWHPGGEDWIKLTKGTDITEAFETHHLNDNPANILPKFYVKNATEPRNSPFTFEENGFYRTLKRQICEELKKIDVVKEANKSKFITDSLFAVILILSVLSCRLENYKILLPVLITCGLCISWCAISSHNFFHQKDNWRMYLFYLTTISHRDWRIAHAISHHLFPNTLFDLEISGFEPIFNWFPNAGHNFTVFIVAPIAYMIAFWIQGLRRIYLFITKEGYFAQHFYWDNFLSLALPIWMFLISGMPLGLVLIRWITLITISSLIFAAIGFNAAHHHPDIFHEGDEPVATTLDWGVHQLETVMDRVEINGSLFRVLTNFGDHGLHHLFPTLDHAVLPHLYPVFTEVCDQFKTKLRISTQLDLIIGQFKQLYRTEVKNRQKQYKEE